MYFSFFSPIDIAAFALKGFKFQALMSTLLSGSFDLKLNPSSPESTDLARILTSMAMLDLEVVVVSTKTVLHN